MLCWLPFVGETAVKYSEHRALIQWLFVSSNDDIIVIHVTLAFHGKTIDTKTLVTRQSCMLHGILYVTPACEVLHATSEIEIQTLMQSC